MTCWIFLRGLTRESRHWGDISGQFQQALPGHTVLALDLPGNGLLNHEASPSRVADLMEHCREQLEQRHIKPPHHVLAMSLGAMVAVSWSCTYPQEVAAQVLINTSMRPFNPFYQRLKPANYFALLKLVMLRADAEQWERTVMRVTSHRPSESVLALWLHLHRDRPVTQLNALRQLLAAARFQAPPDRPAPPTLLLASEQDQLVSVACSKSLARQWRSVLHLHPSAGHDIPLDDGAWVAHQVRDWLQTSDVINLSHD